MLCSYSGVVVLDSTKVVGFFFIPPQCLLNNFLSSNKYNFLSFRGIFRFCQDTMGAQDVTED